MRLRKNDMVKVISGKEKGKTGKILKVTANGDKVIVEKLNFVKRHQRPDARGKGGIVEKEGAIHISNVMLLCSKCEAPVRVGHKVLEDGNKSRVCSKCHELLDA